MPKSSTPITTGKMEQNLRKLGISGKEYREWTGGQSLREFIKVNPQFTLRAFVGICLEYLEYIKHTE